MRLSGTDPALTLQGAPNFRDLGGIVSLGGRRLRSGLVFRSEVLSELTLDDRQVLRQARIGLVCDLRSPIERAHSGVGWAEPGDLLTTIVSQEEMSLAGADFGQLTQRRFDPGFDADRIDATMLATYRAMPAHFGPVLRRLFDALAQDACGAALIHCTAGKDRTGFVCAVLLHALHMPADCVMQDYLATARFVTAQRVIKHLERLSQQPLGPHVAVACERLARVDPTWLDAAFEEIECVWGSLPAYLCDEAGIDDALCRRLQERLLQS